MSQNLTFSMCTLDASLSTANMPSPHWLTRRCLKFLRRPPIMLVQLVAGVLCHADGACLCLDRILWGHSILGYSLLSSPCTQHSLVSSTVFGASSPLDLRPDWDLRIHLSVCDDVPALRTQSHLQVAGHLWLAQLSPDGLDCVSRCFVLASATLAR